MGSLTGSISWSATRKLPFKDGSFHAVFASFTLELFAPDEIPHVLAEFARVLKPDGRIGIVSMATVPPGENPSFLEKSYIWMHRHFPHIVDCQPIDVAKLADDAGFEIRSESEMEIWTMPVRAVVGSLRQELISSPRPVKSASPLSPVLARPARNPPASATAGSKPFPKSRRRRDPP